MVEITINGLTIKCNSGNISINNGKIVVDGHIIDCPIKNYTVAISGNCGNINITGNLTVNGDVKGNIDATGNVICSNVNGDIDATGNVTVKK